jgi:hypothetical protein
MSPSGARQCPKCAGEVREGWRVCPACATPLPAGEDAETETNVCRAYDIGFIEGFHFLSMEYLDGEDLGFADPPHRTLAAR